MLLLLLLYDRRVMRLLGKRFIDDLTSLEQVQESCLDMHKLYLNSNHTKNRELDYPLHGTLSIASYNKRKSGLPLIPKG